MKLEIKGMTCEDCARHVEAALERAGARQASVDWRSGSATVSGEDLSERAVEAALAGTRYRIERIMSHEAEQPSPGAAHYDYDLVVLGSGGGAFAGAIRARDLGKSVLMVECGLPGGTCVNVGCIPSKALLVSSEQARQTGRPTLAEALAAKRTLVEELRQAKYVDLIDAHGIEFRAAQGRLVDGHTVAVDSELLTAEAILLATGAGPAIPEITGLEEAGYLTSTTALELDEAPHRLAVLGAGPVGLELGQMLGGFGSSVTFIARRDILPTAEPEVRAGLRGVLGDDGHRVLAPAITTTVARESPTKVLRGTADGEPFEVRADEILVTAGRRPRTQGLGLEHAGVELDERGAIVVDKEQRTSVSSVFAAGDVTAQPRFVYVAAAGGVAAAQNALGTGGEPLDFRALPRVVFTRPAVARAGLTEAEARAQGLDVETTVLPLSAVPRALVSGDTRGLFKLIRESRNGRLVGASILAEGAPDAIQAAVLAIEQQMTVHELARSWAPYLAMAEGLKLAAQTFERDVAKLSCCAA